MKPTAYHRIAHSLLRPRVLVGWVALVAVVRFVNLGFLDLQAWDEGLHALRSKSIVQFGNWLDQTAYVPGGLATSCYPPLTFWTTAMFYKIFGASEWTTRLTSALLGAGSVWLLVLFMRRSQREGEATTRAPLFAGILFGTNLFYTFFSRQGQLDVAYIFFVLLAAHGWLLCTKEEQRMTGLGLIALGTCGAFMSKILLGLYVPLILMIVQAFEMRRRWQWRRFIEISAAISAGMFLAAPWHVFMYVKHGRGFLDAFFGLHLMQRFSSPIEGHNPVLGVFFYINQVAVRYPESALGIGLVILLLLKKIDRSALVPGVVSISLVWSAVVLAIITLMATKIPQYMLPLSVPVAVLGGMALDLFAQGRLTRGTSLVLLIPLSLTTSWSALWPVRAYIKNSVLGFSEMNPYAAVPWALTIIAIVSTCYCVSMLLQRTSDEQPVASPFFAATLLVLLTLRLAFEVVVNDRTHYATGIRAVASLLRDKGAQRVMYVGKDLNPSLDLYLKGWDTWKTDIQLDHYLSEATALAPQSKFIDLPRRGEATFFVEENRVADEANFSNLQDIKRNSSPLFGNTTYRVYRLDAPP